MTVTKKAISGANAINKSSGQLKFKPVNLLYAGLGIAALAWGMPRLLSVFRVSKDNTTLKRIENEIIEDNLSFDKSQYQIFADRLFNAMNGNQTNEQTIYDVFAQMKTGDDILATISAFGVRETTVWYSSFRGNLISWLEDELDSSELQRVSEEFQRVGLAF